jgi:hypothetical protein
MATKDVTTNWIRFYNWFTAETQTLRTLSPQGERGTRRKDFNLRSVLLRPALRFGAGRDLCVSAVISIRHSFFYKIGFVFSNRLLRVIIFPVAILRLPIRI